MKNSKQFYLVFLFIILFQISFSQEKKPKVALVLSGGGAKGIAHISTLQMLDSLGIVPDLVLGTSMGSIVGGLYAMGYSGDEIEKLTRETDWDVLFGGGISLRDISNEEKSEFKKYLTDFDVVKGKPKVSSAIISDQKLRQYLHSLTYPVYAITDFDDLPIPYRAIATDIVKGEEVILDKGSLNFAMRASMSIPGVFLPVEYNNSLLVDGGVLNNFPVDVAKSMGADIIIGSDVGGGMQPKEKLDNIVSLLFQTGMLSSNLKNPVNRQFCTILIDHVDNLTFGTGDFDKATEIYEQGKIATIKNKQEFINLAEKLKKHKQREHGLPQIKDEFFIDSIAYVGISKQNLGIVKARSNFKPKRNYSTIEINQAVDKVIGTNIFDHINYNVKKDNNESLNLEIHGFEKSQHQVSGSIHFDNNRGIGLIANYTGRNVLGNSSRLLFTADIAEQHRLRLQYQKNFGHNKDWWFRTEGFTEKLDEDLTIGGEVAEDLKYQYFEFDNQINKNLNSFKSYVGIGFNYEFTNLAPRVNPEIRDNLIGLENYQFNSFNIYAHYAYNTMNQVFYPTDGTYFKGTLSRALSNDMEFNYSDETIPNLSESVNGFTKLSFDFEKRMPFNKKLTGVLGAATGFTFYDDIQGNEVSFTDFGFGAKYYLGGNLQRPRKDNYVFQGLNELELPVSQFMMIKMSLQYNISGKMYLTPHFNVASVGFTDFNKYIENAFSPNGSWQETLETSTLLSAGVTTSVNTFLGPIDFDVSWVNDINKIRVFIGVGYQFNRSN